MVAIVKLLIAGVLWLVYLCIEALSHFSWREILGLILCCVSVVAFFSSADKQKKGVYGKVSIKKTEYSDILEKTYANFEYLQTALLHIRDEGCPTSNG